MKLIRFFVVTLFAIITFCFLFSIIPTIVWIFTGNFREVMNDVAYSAFMSVICAFITGYIVNETVDENFRFIK